MVNDYPTHERGCTVTRVIHVYRIGHTMPRKAKTATVKTPNLATIVTRAYNLQGQTIRNDWDLARYCATLPKSTMTSAQRAESVNKAFADAAGENDAPIRISENTFKQLIGAWRSYGHLIDKVAVLYGPTTVYQNIGSSKGETDKAKTAKLATVGATLAAKRAKRHKGAHNGAKTRKANKASSTDDALQAALDRLVATAKSLDLSPAELLIQLLDTVPN